MAATTSDPIILLDTPIVAASFAVSKIGPHVEREKQLWRQTVSKLAENISPKCLIRVPTPACFELMAMNQDWYNFISNSSDDFFRFAHSYISSKIIAIAAQYAFSTNCTSYDGGKQKIKTMDPFIAAYVIHGNHYLITTNQQDFPESHFSVVDTAIMVLSGKTAPYRTIIYLLQPRMNLPSSSD